MTKEILTTMLLMVQVHKTLTYDLSAYANTDTCTVAWEGCMKYYDYYYNEGDNIFIDNISYS